MGCGCKKKKEATLSEPIKQPSETTVAQITETKSTSERDQQQIVDSIIDKLKKINLG